MSRIFSPSFTQYCFRKNFRETLSSPLSAAAKQHHHRRRRQTEINKQSTGEGPFFPARVFFLRTHFVHGPAHARRMRLRRKKTRLLPSECISYLIYPLFYYKPKYNISLSHTNFTHKRGSGSLKGNSRDHYISRPVEQVKRANTRTHTEQMNRFSHPSGG